MNPYFVADQIPLVYYNVNYYDGLGSNDHRLMELEKKCKELQMENEKLKTEIKNLERIRTRKNHRKKKRRSLQDFQKNYECPYKDCDKQYGSELAVNLHIKNKHNGGTKTQREALARQIVLAEEKGERMPKIDLKFPPGYLKEFKKIFFSTSNES